MSMSAVVVIMQCVTTSHQLSYIFEMYRDLAAQNPIGDAGRQFVIDLDQMTTLMAPAPPHPGHVISAPTGAAEAALSAGEGRDLRELTPAGRDLIRRVAAARVGANQDDEVRLARLAATADQLGRTSRYTVRSAWAPIKRFHDIAQATHEVRAAEMPPPVPESSHGALLAALSAARPTATPGDLTGEAAALLATALEDRNELLRLRAERARERLAAPQP